MSNQMTLEVVTSSYEAVKKGTDAKGNDFTFNYRSQDSRKPQSVNVEIYEGKREEGVITAGATFNQDGTMTMNVIKFLPTTFAQLDEAKKVSETIFSEFD